MATSKPRDANCLEQLAGTIEAEIIPRLLMAHAVASGGENARPTPTDVAEFTRLILQHDTAVALTYVDVLRGRGCPLENVLLDLLAPSARTLGEMWNADLSDFGQVTVAAGRLHDVLHALSPGTSTEPTPVAGDRRAILAPAPGEQHTLGVSLVSEFLRHAGWDVVGGPRLSSTDMEDIVHDQWFAVAGLSLSCQRQFDCLVDSIAAIRRASLNKHIGVLVGGPLFHDYPHLLPQVGADATAMDARGAAAAAGRLHASRPDRDGRPRNGSVKSN